MDVRGSVDGDNDQHGNNTDWDLGRKQNEADSATW